MHMLVVHTGLSKWIAAFSWMLVHSVWQGLVLALLVAVLLALTSKWKAAARYNMVLLLVCGFLFTCILTFMREWNHDYNGHAQAVFSTTLSSRVSQLLFYDQHQMKQLFENVIAWLTANSQFIVTAWLIIFAARIVKMIAACRYNCIVKSRQVTQPDVYWQHMVNRLCSKWKIDKAVVLLESGYMKMPVVIGHLKPVILVPAGLFMRLPADQAEAILLHELAHIRRNDYLVNFLQHIVETVFFFNPAVVWISAWLREERENCCDDMAIEHTHNQIGLAEALISFKQQELYGNVYQTAFPGRKNQLLRRAGRLLGNANKPATITEKIFLFAAFALLTGGTASVMLVKGGGQTKKINTALNTVAAAIAPVADNKVTAIANSTVSKQTQQKVTSAARKKIIVAPKPVLVENEIIAPAEAAMFYQSAHLSDKQMAALDRERAISDMIHAKHDQEQALRDQQQAKLDQEQAKKDQAQALKDQARAMLDQQRAYLDQQQALKDKKEAERLQLLSQESIF